MCTHLLCYLGHDADSVQMSLRYECSQARVNGLFDRKHSRRLKIDGFYATMIRKLGCRQNLKLLLSTTKINHYLPCVNTQSKLETVLMSIAMQNLQLVQSLKFPSKCKISRSSTTGKIGLKLIV